jgi:hypothetical protein
MNARRCYLVRWIYEGKNLFLLWRYGEKGPDYYVLRDQDEPVLLMTSTRKEIIDHAKKRDLQTSQDAEHVLDFTDLDKVLRRMRPGKYFSQKMSEVLLNFWNMLDDVSNSVKIQLIPVDCFDKKDLDKLYEKLFFGNNLPSVTPEGSKYFPIMIAKELKILRKLFRQAIATLPKIMDSTLVAPKTG